MSDQVVQELLYKIGADITDLKSKVGEVKTATDSIKESSRGIGDVLTEEFTKGVSGIGPLSSALVKFGGVLTGVGAVVAGIELGKAFVEASVEAQAAQARIAAATGATGERMQQLREVFAQVNTSVAASELDVAAAISAVTTRLGQTGDQAATTATAFLRLASVTQTDLGATIENTSKIFLGFRVAAEDQASVLDALVRTVQSSGVSYGTLSSILTSTGPAFRQIGINAEQAAATVGAMEKAGINASEAMGSLRIFLTRAAQSGLDAGLAFRTVIERIKDAKTESEALAEAQQTFGRQFVQITDFIRRTGFSLDEFVAEARKVPGSLNDSATAAATLGSSFTKLGKTLKEALVNVGAVDATIAGVRALTEAVKAAESIRLDNLRVAFEGTGTAAQKSQAQVADATKKVKESIDEENAAYAKNATAASESAAANAKLSDAQRAAAEASKLSVEQANREATAAREKVAATNAVAAAFTAGLTRGEAFITQEDAINKAGQQLSDGLRNLANVAAAQGTAFNEPAEKLKLYQAAMTALTAAHVPLEEAQALIAKAIAGVDTTKAVSQIENLRGAVTAPIKPSVDTTPIDQLVKKVDDVKSKGATLEIKLTGGESDTVIDGMRAKIAELGKPQEVKITDEEAIARVDEMENRIGGIQSTPIDIQITNEQAKQRVDEIETKLAKAEADAKPIDLTLNTGDSKTKLDEIAADAARVGIAITKVKDASGDVTLHLDSTQPTSEAEKVRLAVEQAKAASGDIVLNLKISSEAEKFTQDVARAKTEISIFGTSLSEIPKTVGASFPQLSKFLSDTGRQFAPLAAEAKAKADQIKQALADGFSGSSDHVVALKEELHGLEEGARIPITVDVSAIGDAISTIGAEISQGAPKLKIQADLSAAQAAIDNERQRIAALPTQEERIAATVALDKKQADLDMEKFRADQQKDPIVVPVTAQPAPGQPGGPITGAGLGLTGPVLSVDLTAFNAALGQVPSAITSAQAPQIQQLIDGFRGFVKENQGNPFGAGQQNISLAQNAIVQLSQALLALGAPLRLGPSLGGALGGNAGDDALNKLRDTLAQAAQQAAQQQAQQMDQLTQKIASDRGTLEQLIRDLSGETASQKAQDALNSKQDKVIQLQQEIADLQRQANDLSREGNGLTAGVASAINSASRGASRAVTTGAR